MSQATHRFMQLLGALFFVISCLQTPMAQQSAIGSLRVSGAQPIAGRSVLDSEPPPMPPTPQLILAAFAKAEAQVREALNQHTFKRDVVLQTIGPNGEVSGEYIRNSQFLFDDKGNRIERVLYHPHSTIRQMRITKEDIQDLAGAQLLGIDITETSKYRLTYAGSEMSGSREVFVIDVAPIQAPNPHRMKERFFVGCVWVDANSFQIVRVRGIVEPHGKQRFPLFETWREAVSGKLCFPTRTEADDVLRFPEFDVHYRIKVRYYDYKRFASKVTIIEINDPPPAN
jgi:hypothetical protein